MRTLLPWLVIPSLVVVAAACLLVARTSTSDREQTRELAAAGRRYDLLIEAQLYVETEVADLIGLDALAEVPSDFDELVEEGRNFAASGTRDVVIDDLFATETMAGRTAHDLATLMPVPPPVGRVLASLAPGIRQRMQAGDQWFVAEVDYVQTLRWIDGQMTDAQQRADEANSALLAYAQAPAYWRTWEFTLFAAMLAVFAILGAIVVAWRVSTATRDLGVLNAQANDRARELSTRAEQFRSLIELGRRLSGDAEPGAIASTIVDETQRLLALDVCVLALVSDGHIVPAATHGASSTASVTFRDGVVGRTAETAMAVRTIVPSEPMFVGLGGPLSLLAVPLTCEGRVGGVLVVGRRGSVMFEPADEMVLSLVGLMSAGALSVAERYVSTLALALDDPLTGLGNRRRLDRDLGELGPERGQAVSFLMIDIDFFKTFNDTYGHPAGDALLRDVGEAIAGAVRSGDIAYRFGGEEFSVLLPNTDAATAVGVAERVRAAVAAIVPAAGAAHITVSVGVSVGTSATPNSLLIDEADRALYDAKRSGRDCVIIAGFPTPPAPPAAS